MAAQDPSPDLSDEVFVDMLYAQLLKRAPRPNEIASWTAKLGEGMSDRQALRRFIASPEYKRLNEVVPGHAPGHFYSPVVNPEEIRDYWERSSQKDVEDLAGVPIDLEAMRALWRRCRPFLQALRFGVEAGGATRYYTSDRRYPSGDAFVLAAMISDRRPQRIVEIGSGFSTAAMLDALDALGDESCQLTCIDPYPERLRSLMRPPDHRRVAIHGVRVQDVDLAVFDTLGSNDILFIDSSHVLKTGSDVHHELFEILPRLAPGVIVHFHDIQFPFEYPREWVFAKRWSWNEIYAVRAFMAYNSRFSTIFFTDLFFQRCAAELAGVDFGGKAVGGSLWIERVAP